MYTLIRRRDLAIIIYNNNVTKLILKLSIQMNFLVASLARRGQRNARCYDKGGKYFQMTSHTKTNKIFDRKERQIAKTKKPKT